MTESTPAIPDVRWGNPEGLVNRLGSRLGATRAGSWAVRTLMPLDRKLLLRTGGRRTLLGPMGAPTMVLETVGRKSGQPRLSPLLFARDGASVVVVGSNFGQQHHPAWTGNLLANPDAVVIAGGQRVRVSATRLVGTEADEAFALMVAVTDVYATYRTRTDRELRVFRLTPRV